MIGPICREEMRVLTAAYAKITGRGLAAISRKYYGNSRFLSRFIAGDVSMEIKTFDELTERIRADLSVMAARGKMPAGTNGHDIKIS